MAKNITAVKEMLSWGVDTKMMMLSDFVDGNGQTRQPLFSEAKVLFWFRVVREFCATSRSATFELAVVSQFVSKKVGGAPLCLPKVVLACQREREIVAFDTMVRELADKDQGRNWSLTGIWRRLFSFSDRNPVTEDPAKLFVVPQILQDLMHTISEKLHAQRNTEDIKLLETFKQKALAVMENESSFGLCLLLLQKRQKCTVVTSRSGTQYFVYIRDKTTFKAPEKDELEIIELDAKIDDLNRELEVVLQKMDGLDKKAAKYRAAFNFDKYQECVRLRKLMEAEIERLNLERSVCVREVTALKEKVSDNRMKKRVAEEQEGGSVKRQK